ncbi:MAG: HAD family phosphatase [Deltaproteobacteria bacterium]|nr:HAD family phosphatase [Deltaproteobacteria bacterium]
MHKLLAVDVDGTLLRRDGQIDQRDEQAIGSLRARGVRVTIVTGRLYSGTRELVRRLGLDAPVACADGAAIVDSHSERELEHTGIAGAAAALLRRALRKRELALFPFYGDAVLHDERGLVLRRYLANWTPVLEQVGDVLEHPCWSDPRGISTIVAVGPVPAVTELAVELRGTALFAVDDFAVARALGVPAEQGIRALLAHAAGVTKGAAVRRVAELCGCEPGEVVSVGDWVNDVPMFAASGRSFAMAHAPEPVRSAATDVLAADSSTGGGVAEAIARAWPG